jgi:hypothetical protein
MAKQLLSCPEVIEGAISQVFTSKKLKKLKK